MSEPNWSSPPGDTILRLMDNKEMDASELADALGLSDHEFNNLVAGERRLTEENAKALAENLGSTARFWLSRDAAYVLDMARLDGQNSPNAEVSWLDSMPTSSMRKYGWVSKGIRAKDKLKDEILKFFGCSTLQEWGQRYSSGIRSSGLSHVCYSRIRRHGDARLAACRRAGD
ncbi:hypothetical protein OF122_12595 [Pelagibacterium flavum]|uniref:HTH cro/C1-type domain-containing protein n=1 Tax=Pelagibacterium flavum TaxID=2984530 RepID=A0ABY6IN64_9HYPH|nr:hypothetical protein [Pelagibacterium sp. YIM 151497]UYQ70899.1 hypothetical protein OF122_12595 [Pelagibacterium sp. YIM 151497]